MTLDGVVPFPPEFVARYRAKGYWEDRSLASVFEDVFARFANRVALIAGAERVTYRELAARVERLARHFLALEIRPLDRVVVQLPNVPEFVYVYFALQHGLTLREYGRLQAAQRTTGESRLQRAVHGLRLGQGAMRPPTPRLA